MKKGSLKVLWAARTKFPQNWGIKPHHHDYFQLFYIQSGSCTFIISGKTIDVTTEDYIFVYPNVVHAMQKNHNDMVRMVDIKFTVNNLAITNKLKEVLSVSATPESVKYFFKLISTEIKNQNNFHKEIVEAFTYILVLKLLTNSVKTEQTEIFSAIEKQGWPVVCQYVAQYIYEHYTNKIDLNDISQALGYNKNYLCDSFKKQTGITIMNYLKSVRIEKSCELIELSDYTFSQICYMVGFKSIHHFDRIFKSVMGITPTEYKLKIIETNSSISKKTYKNEDHYDVN